MNDLEKKTGEREIGELAAAWYGDPFADDDEDAVEIRRKGAKARTPGAKNVAPATTAAAKSPVPAARNTSANASGASVPAARPATTATASAPAARPANAPAPASRPAASSAPARTAAPAARPAGTENAARPATPAARTAPQGNRPVNAPARPASPGTRPVSSGSRPVSSGTRPANGTRPASSGTRTVSSGSRSAGEQSGVRRQSSMAQNGAVGKIVIPKPRARQKKITVGCVIRRTLLVVLTVVLFAAGLLLAVCGVIAKGPSETARNKAVMSALQASATKWAPGLFLSDEVVEQIKKDSTVVITDEKNISDVVDDDDDPTAPDRWANAVDGMYYETINGKTYKGYVLFIKDPARVSVAISDPSFRTSQRIFEIVDQYNAVAAINGGEFPDNGVQTGCTPIGLTYSDGECVWDDGYRRTFFGFTKDNKLFVGEGTTRAEADAMGIRDAVAFQEGNTLITNDGEKVTYYYADSNTGVAQRTAIAQLADGTVLFLVTDGRTASSMGATKNDIIDVLAEYGAVTAGLLDGGSSSMLYYRDYYDIYHLDKSVLDEWQLMGLVNKYKAFTNPRRIPTFFIVK